MSLLSRMKAGARDVVERAKTEVKSELEFRREMSKDIRQAKKKAYWKEKKKIAVKGARAKARGGGFGGGSGSLFDISGKKKKKEMKWF